MNRKLWISTIFFAAISLSSQASVLSFEDLTTEEFADLNATVNNYAGFSWSDGLSLYNSSIFPTSSHSGGYGLVNAYGLDTVVISSNDIFNFEGAWLNGWFFNAPSSIVISGYDASNNLIGSIEQSVSESAEVYAAANFVGVSRIELVGGQYFTIDDFAFNTSSVDVPEPSSLILVGLGFAALCLSRRRFL